MPLHTYVMHVHLLKRPTERRSRKRSSSRAVLDLNLTDQPRPQGFSLKKWVGRENNVQLNGSLAFESHTHENIDSVRDVIIFHCYSLLSAQNQRVAYKLASQEYLGCTRDQPMPGPFPAPPIF